MKSIQHVTYINTKKSNISNFQLFINKNYGRINQYPQGGSIV